MQNLLAVVLIPRASEIQGQCLNCRQRRVGLLISINLCRASVRDWLNDGHVTEGPGPAGKARFSRVPAA